jgi:predicted RNA-binding protein associated with RNAse of E/G family
MGIVALYTMERVAEPLWKPLHGQPTLLAADGFAWLQFYPTSGGKNGAAIYSATAMIAPDGAIAQWYIDICAECGITREGVPWHDDLYLDLITAGKGDVETLDAGELESALDAGAVTPAHYQAAWNVAHQLTPQVRALTLPEVAALPTALPALRALEARVDEARVAGYEPLYRTF